IAVQTPGSGISILLAVGTPSTGSWNLYCQWELSPGSGNALCITSPCLKPRMIENSEVGLPLTKIEVLEDSKQALIQALQVRTKPSL
nr:hypothetical protein [Tanacetum cinerariifolium]